MQEIYGNVSTHYTRITRTSTAVRTYNNLKEIKRAESGLAIRCVILGSRLESTVGFDHNHTRSQPPLGRNVGRDAVTVVMYTCY